LERLDPRLAYLLDHSQPEKPRRDGGECYKAGHLYLGVLAAPDDPAQHKRLPTTQPMTGDWLDKERKAPEWIDAEATAQHYCLQYHCLQCMAHVNEEYLGRPLLPCVCLCVCVCYIIDWA
jgi:hypothetical protein